MSATSIARKINVRDNDIKDRSGYMTTTEVSKLCGVSRFTIINWIKRGRIQVIRTVGSHYRIPETEVVSLLRTLEKKQKTSVSSDEERGKCLISNEKKRLVKPKKNNVLYAFGYSVGRSVHALKGRCKVK